MDNKKEKLQATETKVLKYQQTKSNPVVKRQYIMTKFVFISGMQDWWNIRKSTNVLSYLDGLEKKNHIIISLQQKKKVFHLKFHF